MPLDGCRHGHTLRRPWDWDHTHIESHRKALGRMVLQGMPTHSATNIFTHTNNYTHIYMDTNRRAETDTGTHAHTYARTYADACERRETYNSQPQTHLSLTRHLQTQASMHTLTHTRTHARTHADTHARTRARIHARMHTRRRLRAERDVPVYFDSG